MYSCLYGTAGRLDGRDGLYIEIRAMRLPNKQHAHSDIQNNIWTSHHPGD